MIRAISAAAFGVVLGACASTKTERLTGVIAFGPERMSFLPCESKEQWWLARQTFDAKGWDQVNARLEEQPHCDLGTMPCRWQTVDVVGEAILSAEKPSGHAGNYQREVKFLQIEPVDLAFCRASTDSDDNLALEFIPEDPARVEAEEQGED